MKIKNNPLNIKYKPCNNWQGQLKPLKGYCRFKSVDYGFRAGIILYMRLRTFDNNTFKHFVFSLYDDNERSRDYVINLINAINDVIYHPVLGMCEKVSELSPITFQMLPLILCRLSSFEQGFLDTSWDKIVCNTLTSYLLKCGCINDCNEIVYY